jgi:hypothetical protein
VIIHFEDPGTGICGGKSLETGIGILGLQRSEYRVSRRQEIGNFYEKSPGKDLRHSFVETHVGDTKRIGDQHFMSPGDKEDLHCRIAKSNFMKERRAPLCGGQLTSYHGSGY